MDGPTPLKGGDQKVSDTDIHATKEELRKLIFNARAGNREDGLTEEYVYAYVNNREGRRNTLEGERLQRAIESTEAAILAMRNPPEKQSAGTGSERRD